LWGLPESPNRVIAGMEPGLPRISAEQISAEIGADQKQQQMDRSSSRLCMKNKEEQYVSLKIFEQRNCLFNALVLFVNSQNLITYKTV
jgi:hypothetical protein